MTTENDMYGPGWKTCARCRLTAPDVKSFGGINLCPDPTRCSRVFAGEPLSAPPTATCPSPGCSCHEEP